LHDVILSIHSSVFVNLINVVGIWDVAVSAWVAISAQSDIRAWVAVIVASGSVDRAGLVSDEVVLDVLVGGKGLTSMAPEVVVGVTGDQNLGSKVDVWPGGISYDLNSI
jgi:hypothetical protein